MTPREFNSVLAATRYRLQPDSATVKALRSHYVDGTTVYQAARDQNIAASAVYRAQARFNDVLKHGICPTCGQPRRK